MKNEILQIITKQFFEHKVLLSSKVLKGGIIHQTYLVELGNSQKSDWYILQKVNQQVFKRPEIVMSNLSLISRHIQKKIEKNKDLSYQNFKAYPDKKGNFYHVPTDNSFWRLIDYIDAKPISNNQLNNKIITEAGKLLGCFHKILSDINLSKIQVSIPNFHHPNLYYKALLKNVKKDSIRLQNTFEVFKKIKKYRYLIKEFSHLKEKKLLPKRLVHNDPKLDNILFNSSGKACTIIDLDTCMPGYLNFDFGDAIRSISNTRTENEKNLDKVHFNLEIFKVFSKAYLNKIKPIITSVERENLAFFALLVTYEQSIRFYNDYIQGNIYYKIDYPKHNLQRAKVQLKLLEEMSVNFDKMKAIIVC